GDGLKDLVTGKRYFAHQGNDPGGKEPAVLYWFELRRPQKGKVEFIPHKIDDDSGVGTQFEVTDMNKDGKWDIVTSNKKGVHVFLQIR
ncbi:MAG: VCBS repeat-containing protein, partial [Phycisphaerae bacterium]|nr:VCBS repeat-containing protein [Phycisphaerae bacterium]